MLIGQGALIAVNGVILVATALALAPSIFSGHLTEAGVTSASTRDHVTDAYITSFQFSLVSAAVISVVVSGALAWYFVLRIVRPIDEVTTFAQSLASGDVNARSPLSNSSSELEKLTSALAEMSVDLTKSREELARMLSDLAHELRTPISTVLAIVDGIEDQVVTPDAHTWQTIRDQLERVNRLSRDVREVSNNSEKILSKLTIEIEPKTIASSAFAAWSPKMIGKGVTFELDLEEDLPKLHVDPQRVGQVLSNLLENALRHTPASGSVKLSSKQLGDFVLFTVNDSGEGIEQHQLPLIFDRLYRGDAARHSGDTGSGLGLTIAKSIAQSHGGKLTASSAGRDLGSIFTLSLPIPS
ncbi:MAG: histidine kinase [Actinobacteria bacterium]|nr:histidine kinase [Actinomycetota bacterium]